MADLFAWQLAGDVLKAGAYVFGYVVIARASLRTYLLAELSQLGLLLASAWILVPAGGALGAVQSYLVTYLLYFPLCAVAFHRYRRRA